jgi:hypothetical protein
MGISGISNSLVQSQPPLHQSLNCPLATSKFSNHSRWTSRIERTPTISRGPPNSLAPNSLDHECQREERFILIPLSVNKSIL